MTTLRDILNDSLKEYQNRLETNYGLDITEQQTDEEIRQEVLDDTIHTINNKIIGE